MRDKVVVAGNSGKKSHELALILQKHYEAVVCENMQAFEDYIEKNSKNTLAVVSRAAFLDENQKSIAKLLKALKEDKNIPVIAAGTASELEKAVNIKGVADYIEEPFSEMLLIHRVKTAAELFKVKKKNAGLAKKIQDLKNQKFREVQSGVTALISSIIEARNPICGKHTRYVRRFTEIIANDVMKHCPQYGLTPEKVQQIIQASIMHDIGKVTVPDAILLKPARFSDEEYIQVKTHTTVGKMLFDNTGQIWGKDYADLCRDIILYHHERYDGNGYPHGLKGEEIPIAAQIVSLADVYDALVSQRVYKDNIEPQKAYEMIMRGECGAFSANMLGSLERTKSQLESLLQ